MGSISWEEYIANAPVKTAGDLPILDGDGPGRINKADLPSTGPGGGDLEYATTSTPGKVTRASDSEMEAGTNDDKYGSPKGSHIAAGAVIDATLPEIFAVTYGVQAGAASDQSTALAAAISAAGNNRTIRLPAGTIRLDEEIAITGTNVTVIGADAGTIIDASAMPNTDSVFHATGTGCRVANMTIDCGLSAIFGVRVNGPFCTLQNLTVNEAAFHGYYVESDDDASFLNCHANDCGDGSGPFIHAAGFYVSTGNRARLTGCTATGNYEHGFYLYGNTESDLTFSDCSAYSNGESGFSSRYSRTAMTGCISVGNGGVGVEFSGVAQEMVTMTGCVIEGNGDALTTSEVFIPNGVTNLVVVGNTIRATAAVSAVRFVSATKTLLAGNAIENSGAGVNAVMLSGACDFVTIASNNIQCHTSATDSTIINVLGTSNAFVVGNQIRNGIYGVKNDGTGVVRCQANQYVTVTTPEVLCVGGGTAAPFVTNLWYGTPGVRGTFAVTVERECAVPLQLPAAGATVDRIGVTTTASGGTGAVARLGIRADNNGLPGALILDAGTIAVDDAPGDKVITISQKLTGPRVWLTCTTQVGTAATYRSIASTPSDNGESSAANAGGAVHTAGYYATGITGALPAGFTTAASAALPPRVYVRST